jgi:hypothetical protein
MKRALELGTREIAQWLEPRGHRILSSQALSRPGVPERPATSPSSSGPRTYPCSGQWFDPIDKAPIPHPILQGGLSYTISEFRSRTTIPRETYVGLFLISCMSNTEKSLLQVSQPRYVVRARLSGLASLFPTRWSRTYRPLRLYPLFRMLLKNP